MLSLRLGIAACVTAAAVCAAGVVGWRALEYQRVQENAAQLRSARFAAGLVADEVAPDLEQGRRPQIQGRLNQVLRAAPGMRMAVLDAAGQRVASVPRDLPATSDPGQSLATVYGSSGTRIGSVLVAIPQQRPTGPLAGFRLVVESLGIPLAATIPLSLALLTFLAAGLITTPLARARHVLEQFRQGNFAAKMPVRGSAAVRSLARMINGLSPQLASMSAQSRFVNNIVESMVDALVVVDKEAKIQAVNPATLELLGYGKDELVGRALSVICVADGNMLGARQLESLLSGGAKKDHEAIFIAKDGRQVPISLSGSAIKDAGGASTGYVCIGTDISGRKSAEADREQMHKQLMSISRQAGMAEVATGVLHNVGNVLNSVNIAASLAEEMVRRSRTPRLSQLAELVSAQPDLAAFVTGDQRGKALPGYLTQLASHLNEEQQQLEQELKTLNSHVSHIKDIISVQQSVSKVSGVTEEIAVSQLVEDALRMVAGTLTRGQAAVEREFAVLPPVRTDKHRVLQILVNLLTNAAEAMGESADRGGLLRIRIAPDGTDTAKIEIADNGGGIAAENLTRIFTHGFTTKKAGHGFGLHNAALTARELGGSLTAQSEGLGRGATFVLRLPIRFQELAVAA